jgi:hypothetical protein
MAYAEDLKFSGAKVPCGFESRPRHIMDDLERDCGDDRSVLAGFSYSRCAAVTY